MKLSRLAQKIVDGIKTAERVYGGDDKLVFYKDGVYTLFMEVDESTETELIEVLKAFEYSDFSEIPDNDYLSERNFNDLEITVEESHHADGSLNCRVTEMVSPFRDKIKIAEDSLERCHFWVR